MKTRFKIVLQLRSKQIYYIIKNLMIITIYFIFSLLVLCSNETYGYLCREQCGECRYNTTCHNANGTCINGCEPGYFGELCKTCMFKHFDICLCLIRMYVKSVKKKPMYGTFLTYSAKSSTE